MREQPQATGPYSWADFIELGEDDARELIDGHFVEVDVPTRTHERIVATLIAILVHWSWSKNAGEVLASGYKVRIHDQRGAMPDIQFYRRDNLPDGQEKGLERGRPDLAIEVISPTSRSKDSVQKLQDYASIGVPEYWLLDPEEQTLQRLVLRDDVPPKGDKRGIYGIVDALQGNIVFRPDGFEDLEIDLQRLWQPAAGEGS